MGRILKKSWHEAFAECVSPHSDAPDNFIIWSALSLIGATLKDNVWFEYGTYTIYPNLFIILVAPPGIGKGTAMNIIENMIEETEPNRLVNTLSDRITAEKILIRIADGWAKAPSIKNQQLVIGAMDHSCLCFSTELRVLLGASEWMLEFLEEAWSKTKYDNETKNKGSVFIKEMCFSLLAASVPDFLRNVNREAKMVISGGFTSRCLFIYADAPSKDLPWPEPLKDNKRSKALYDDLVADLKTISVMSGKFSVDASAKILFENFLKLNRQLAAKEYSEAVLNSRARIKANTLKLAMVFSASRGDSLIINQVDMVNAIVEITKVIERLGKLFRGAGEGMDTATSARVQEFIEKCGRTTEKEIYRALHAHINSPETLNRILYVLETIGFCTKSSGVPIYYQHVKGKS